MDQLQSLIFQTSQKTDVKQHVVEKDYLLSYLLAGIASQPELSQTLIFKGGTALKKFYFGNYRFSEDLDFSEDNAPKGNALEQLIQNATKEAQRLLTALHGPFPLTAQRYEEKNPHPREQEAFIVRAKFPWQREPLCRVKIEISRWEKVVLDTPRRAMIHVYNEDLPVQMRCYRLEEVVTEKMLATLETHQKLASRGWSKPRARDYYDLWRIFGEYGGTLERGKLPGMLEEKSLARGIRYSSINDFFTKELVAVANANWDNAVGNLISNLPPCNSVLAELRATLPNFFPSLAKEQVRQVTPREPPDQGYGLSR